MKTLTQALKTLTVSLTLVYGVNSVSFAADSSSNDKLLNKSQLMELLRQGGLPEGTQQGVSTEGNACELAINTKAGEEKLSLKSTADEYAQQLIFEEYVSDILFQVSESKSGITIKQDFFDSFQDISIEKTSSNEVRITATENIASDERTLTCIFK